MELLLIIDMQNVYLPSSPWACVGILEAADSIEKLISQFKHVAFTLFDPPLDPKGQWCLYNKENKAINEDEWMNAPIDVLLPYMHENNTYHKSTYAFNDPMLEKYDTVYVTGVVAECCVLSTIFSLIDQGKKVIVLEDAIAGENKEKIKEIKDIMQGLSPMHIEFKRSRN